jgi:hypothetical protein
MPDTLRPGDIWLHKGMGHLIVTDEDSGHPGYLRCYWSIGGHPQGLATTMDPTKTQHLNLILRTCPDA